MEPGAVILGIISGMVLGSACAYMIVANFLARTNKIGDSKAGLSLKKCDEYTTYRMHTIRQRQISQRDMEREIKEINSRPNQQRMQFGFERGNIKINNK